MKCEIDPRIVINSKLKGHYDVCSLAPHANKLKYLLNENSSTIFTAVGVGGTVATAYLTGRATFKAADLIAEAEVKHLLDDDEEVVEVSINDSSIIKLSKTEKTKLVWKLYLPPVASGVLTITSIIVAHRISAKKIAALD